MKFTYRQDFNLHHYPIGDLAKYEIIDHKLTLPINTDYIILIY